MANITAADVNKLRQATGAGMMDCKAALIEAEGDFDKAIEVLRKKGQKVAAKRADRDSKEGAVIAQVNANHTVGAIISLNCETDFVAKNADFVALAKDLALLALGVNNKEELLALNYKGISVAEKLIEQTGVIGEKIELGAFEKVEAKETEARIAIIEKENEELHRLGKPLKHVPQYVSYAQLTAEVLAKAEADAKAELKAEGKPEQIWDKILPGKIQRFISDNTTLDQEKALLDQVYIYDESKKVSDFVKSKNVEITSFKRVAL